MNTTAQNRTLSASLTVRQLRAIAVILNAPSMEAAARRAHVGRTTLYQWLREPAFRDELNCQQNEVFNDAFARVKSLVGNAINGLSELIENAKSETVKRAACRDILDAALKVKELHELEGRLAAIEKTLGGHET